MNSSGGKGRKKEEANQHGNHHSLATRQLVNWEGRIHHCGGKFSMGKKGGERGRRKQGGNGVSLLKSKEATICKEQQACVDSMTTKKEKWK